jgi:transposase-like protein
LTKCPACGSTRVFPSRVRNVLERIRQLLTEKQPFRCHQCSWRNWQVLRVHPVSPDVHPEDLRTGRVSEPVSPTDLDQLDNAALKADPLSR